MGKDQFVKRGKYFLLPLAKGGGLPARSRFGEGRGGILKDLFQTAKLIQFFYLGSSGLLGNAIPNGESRGSVRTVFPNVLKKRG
jgi:hypothetical protein